LVLRDNVIEYLRELHEKERRNLYYSINVTKVMKGKKCLRKNKCRMDKMSTNFKQVQGNFCIFSAE